MSTVEANDNDLLTVIDGPVARITFNRPQARNAIAPHMVQKLLGFLDKVAVDKSIRCVVLTGEGDHFMAGGDIAGFSKVLEMPSEERRKDFQRRASTSIPIFENLLTMPQPVVARVRGACAGAAVGFASSCDFVVADESALFVVAHVHIATSPDGATSYALSRRIGAARAAEMAMLGGKVSAQKAYEWGLVNTLVPSDQLDGEVESLVERIVALPGSAVSNIKSLYFHSHHNSMEDQLALEAENFADCAAHPDFVEGITAFMEKRKPNFNGV